MTSIAPHITAFLRERLTCENTRAAYAYTFQLLFAFASRRLRVAPSDLQVEQIDAQLVLAFLDHIQHERTNGARTRNLRLAAIRSFMRFIEYRVPAALDQIRRVLAIPVQRTDTRLVKHLSTAESRALLDAPDPTSRLGIRDRAMLYLGLTGGLRVSELVGLRLDDVRFDGRYVEILVHGKGRKERVLLLWREVGRRHPGLARHPRPRRLSGAVPLSHCSTDDALGICVCVVQARPRREDHVPISGRQESLAPCATSHVRTRYAPSHRRPAEGCALAWARTAVDHRNLPSGGPD